MSQSKLSKAMKWTHHSCRSCNGVGEQWRGEWFSQCWTCKGWGEYFIHDSGVRAAYPGGPFV